MTRKWLPFLAILFLALLVAAVLLLFQARSRTTPPAANVPEENALDPVRDEMACIDQVLANRNLKTEEVQPALDTCRSRGASETRLVNRQ